MPMVCAASMLLLGAYLMLTRVSLKQLNPKSLAHTQDKKQMKAPLASVLLADD